jgi:hypothetical protein
VVSLIAETPSLNPAVVVVGHLHVTLKDLLRESSRDRHEFTEGSFRGLPAELRALAALFQGDRSALIAADQPFHPTARYRLLMLMLGMFGEEETFKALCGIRFVP